MHIRSWVVVFNGICLFRIHLEDYFSAEIKCMQLFVALTIKNPRGRTILIVMTPLLVFKFNSCVVRHRSFTLCCCLTNTDSTVN